MKYIKERELFEGKIDEDFIDILSDLKTKIKMSKSMKVGDIVVNTIDGSIVQKFFLKFKSLMKDNIDLIVDMNIDIPSVAEYIYKKHFNVSSTFKKILIGTLLHTLKYSIEYAKWEKAKKDGTLKKSKIELPGHSGEAYLNMFEVNDNEYFICELVIKKPLKLSINDSEIIIRDNIAFIDTDCDMNPFAYVYVNQGGETSTPQERRFGFVDPRLVDGVEYYLEERENALNEFLVSNTQNVFDEYVIFMLENFDVYEKLYDIVTYQ